MVVGFDSRWVRSCDSHRVHFCGGGKDHCHGASRIAWLTVETSTVEAVWEQIAIRVWMGGTVV